MAACKNLTYKMKKELSKRLKDFNVNEWGYSKNTIDFIELVHKTTGEKKQIRKGDFNITSF